jgi:hypothetical protein
LAGASSQATFHLKQAMGGGKTHLLVGFGLLAKHPALIVQECRTQRPSRLPISLLSMAATIPTIFSGAIANQIGKGDQSVGVFFPT